MKHEKIRAALAAMPTEGPWFHHHPAGSQHSSGGYVSASEDRHEDALCHVCYEGSGVPALTNGAFIAACNPAAVSTLLSERDALVEALEGALASLEVYAVTVDAEWGNCRDIAELEADNALPECIKVARAALTAYRKGGA